MKHPTHLIPRRRYAIPANLLSGANEAFLFNPHFLPDSAAGAVVGALVSARWSVEAGLLAELRTTPAQYGFTHHPQRPQFMANSSKSLEQLADDLDYVHIVEGATGYLGILGFGAADIETAESWAEKDTGWWRNVWVLVLYGLCYRALAALLIVWTDRRKQNKKTVRELLRAWLCGGVEGKIAELQHRRRGSFTWIFERATRWTGKGAELPTVRADFQASARQPLIQMRSK